MKKIKKDPELWSWILDQCKKSPIELEDDKEKVHFALTKEPPICSNGKRRVFKRPVEGYVFCGGGMEIYTVN